MNQNQSAVPRGDVVDFEADSGGRMKKLTGEVICGEIVDIAQSARDEVELKGGIIESLQKCVPFDYCVWTPLTADVLGTTVHAGASDIVGHAQRTLDGDKARYYDRGFVSRLVAAGGLATDAELTTSTERETHPMYTEVLHPTGIRSLLFCTIHFQGRALSGITLGRRDRRPYFAARDLERFRSIRGVLALAEAAFLHVEPMARATGLETVETIELSPRESQVAKLVARGFQNKEVAGLLGTSPETVRKQTVAIYRKMAVKGRVQLAARLAALAAASGD